MSSTWCAGATWSPSSTWSHTAETETAETTAGTETTKGGAREAHAPFIVSVAAVVSVLAVSVSVVCDQVDEGDQAVPAHQVDDIDEVHELDPVHQVDHKDEQWSRPLETGPRKIAPGKPSLENRLQKTALENIELTLDLR